MQMQVPKAVRFGKYYYFIGSALTDFLKCKWAVLLGPFLGLLHAMAGIEKGENTTFSSIGMTNMDSSKSGCSFHNNNKYIILKTVLLHVIIWLMNMDYEVFKISA